MNGEVRWRLDFGRDLSERLARFQQPGGIRASAIGGSVARGLSDVYSDLELILLWEKAPDPPTRQEIMTALGAEYRLPAADPGHDSSLAVQGIPVDLWHLTIAVEEATLRQVLDEYSLDLVASNRLDTFRNCIPLFGHDLLNEWKARIEQYPDELTIRFLRTYLPHFHLRQLNLVARRDNPTAYFHTLTDIQCSLYLILLALNHVYFPTFKWMYPIMETFAVSPKNLTARLRRMFEVPPLEAAGQLQTLLAETLAIMEEHYPQIDTAFARYSLDQAPQIFSAPPSPNP